MTISFAFTTLFWFKARMQRSYYILCQ